MASTPEKYFSQLRGWIEQESIAERSRIAARRQRRNDSNAERHGETLLDLAITDYRSGLGGRFLVSFVKRNRTLDLPWNRFRVGSPVLLSADDQPEDYWLNGIVSAKNNRSIEIALDDWPDGDRFRIDMSADEITRARQLSALNAIEKAKGRTAQLRDILLGEREPRIDEVRALEIGDELNDAQKQSIQFSMASRDFSIIHGPPGTGKTTTVVELIHQAVRKGEKVLACAPSNTGVDNLLERLAMRDIRVVRIGHPARVQELLQRHTLDAIVELDGGMKVVRDMMKEAEQLSKKASKFTRGKPAAGAKQDWRAEARRLREDAKLFEKQIVAHVLDRADVICATTTFDPDVLGDRRFDLAVIDEACQSTEPGCWPVVLRAEKLVLAGDHCQLPPTVLSAEAAREGFAISMMERLVGHYGDTTTRLLNVQYRMHEQIMRFSSDQFYDGALIAAPSVISHQLRDLPNVRENTLTESTVSFIDTAGASWDEELEPDGESKLNPQEGQLVVAKVRELCEHGVKPADIAVIAPYAAQVRWIRERMPFAAVEVDTVDGFQGREKEVVIITLVRSNGIGEIGFLADTRRMNVAMTRARRRLIVIGDSATLANNAFYASMLEYFESIGAYQTVWEQ